MTTLVGFTELLYHKANWRTRLEPGAAGNCSLQPTHMYTAWRQGQAFNGQAWRASFTRIHATHTGITPHSVSVCLLLYSICSGFRLASGTGCIPNHPGLFPTLLLISSFWDTTTHLGSSHLLSFYGGTLQKWLISLDLKCWSLSLGLGLAVNMVWVIVKTNVCSHAATELSALNTDSLLNAGWY